MKFSPLVLFLLFIGVAPKSDLWGLELSPLFSNNGVLQRDQSIPVWGWGAPGENVVVEFADQKAEVEADKEGTWRVHLKPLKLNKSPQDLVVTSGKEKLVKNNLLVGDVWLCAGQSNMEMTFVSPRLPVDVPKFFRPEDFPLIRHLAVKSLKGKNVGLKPLEKLDRKQVSKTWAICGKETYKKFTATGLFFAYHLNKELGVPIGLLNCTKGNTRIDSWLSKESANLIQDQIPMENLIGVYNNPPFTQYNMQIAPVTGFGIKGAIWYQGEANGKEGAPYFWKMKALIEGWRQDWGQGDFPFYFVQLPSFNGKKKPWAETREAQRRAMSIPNTGMVVLTDAGQNDEAFPINLHPRNKFVVGQRLSLWALANTYQKSIVYSGPLFKSASYDEGKVTISFDHIGGGLIKAKKESSRSLKPPQPVSELLGFELADSGGQWHLANAVIEKNHVIITSEKAPLPKGVRYLYCMNTDHGTLYNKEGLPASPFLSEK